MLAGTVPQPVWDHEITTNQQPPAEWIWHGFLARAGIMLLTGMWKSGKTTLLSLLLSRRKEGGTLAGIPVQPGKTVVISEESSTMWSARARHYDFGGKVCFFPQPFVSLPSHEEWQALLASVLKLHDDHGVDLAVIDPLAPFLRAENSPRIVFETLLPLTALTRRGMSVLAMHHPAKGQPHLGQAARGSGALLGHVDISIEMRHPGGNPLTRRRRLLALSRHAETLRQLLLELNADGADYTVISEDHADEFQANWSTLRLVLDDAPQKLTRLDILEEWPADFDKPSATVLRKWLDRAVDRALLACEGSGRKSDPFRYWLPEREAVWKQDFLYEIIEQQTRELKLPYVSLTEKKCRKRADDAAMRRQDAAAGRDDDRGDDDFDPEA